MKKSELTEIKRNHEGTGLLIENDGYISMSEGKNKNLLEFNNNEGWRCPYPFIVDAVFQKFGIKNANGRIYPENILKREVEKYQQRINEKRALGECYKPDVLVLTENGWKTMSDIKIGDNIVTLNVSTKKTEIQQVLRKIEYQYNGEMIKLKNNKIDEIVTPKHKFILFNKNGDYVGPYDANNLVMLKETHGSWFIPSNQNDIMEEPIKLEDIEISSEHYEGMVMCVEVKNHNFFVMSNDKSHWTANCNHPADSTIDLGRISHNIIELHWEGRTLVGKLELNVSKGFVDQGICSTLGDTVANLLLNGYKIGVSSRGVGSVEQKLGQYIVGDDFELICWDVVADPSTPMAYIGFSQEELEPYLESKKTKKNVVNEKINKIKSILG